MASSSQILYTTTTAVKAILPPTLPSGITTSNIETRIRDASAYIDGKLKPAYPVPFITSTPEHVETMAKEGAAHLIRRDAFQADRRVTDPAEPYMANWIDDELESLVTLKTELPGATKALERAYFPEIESC